MDKELATIVAALLVGVTPLTALVVLLLFFPEKIEKWSALLWKILSNFGTLFRFAHKRYVKHDLQGRVNEFVRHLRRQVPTLGAERLAIEWIDAKDDRKSFFADGRLVLRLRRDDPHNHNFIHGAFLFVSGALLHRTKRYLAPTQRDAIDLFVCAKIVEQEKPEIVGFFLDEYLHPKTDDPKSRVAVLVDDFARLDRAALFFPVFVQELEFLGDKVFGRRRDDLVHKEVSDLIQFLHPIAERKIGDENDLEFSGDYCRFGLVLIGKRSKLFDSIEPYVGYIRKQLVNKEVETIYLIARRENRAKVEQIAERFADQYDIARRLNFEKLLRYSGDDSTVVLQFMAILRRKGVPLIQPSEPHPRAVRGDAQPL